MSVQSVLIDAGALVLLASTIALVRKRLLSIRYGLGWIAVSLVGLLGAPFLALLSRQAHSLGFTPTGFSLGIFIVFLGLLCLQLSISLSGLHHAIQDLAEHSAFLEARVHRLEEGDPGVELDSQTSQMPYEEPA
jgi:Na+/melibiose symporter-like transporter